MGADWKGPNRVDLDSALRTMIQEVGLAGARPGIRTEEFEIELRFSLDDDGGGEVRPVVHLGGSLPESEVHVVRVSLRPRPVVASGDPLPTVSGGGLAEVRDIVASRGETGADGLSRSPSSAPSAETLTQAFSRMSGESRPRRRLRRRRLGGAAATGETGSSPSSRVAADADIAGIDDETRREAAHEPPPEDETGAAAAREALRRGLRLEGGLTWRLDEPTAPPGSIHEAFAETGASVEPDEAPTFLGEDSFPEDPSTDTLEMEPALDDGEDTEA